MADTAPQPPVHGLAAADPGRQVLFASPARLAAARRKAPAPKDKAPHKAAAAIAKDVAAHAKPATKRVAALDKRRKQNADADADAAYVPPTQRMANAAPARQHTDALPDESDPPLDAGDLPGFAGSSVPPQASAPDLPPDSSMPPPAPFVPAPYSPATAASGAPVMLLPPITAQTAR